MPQNNETKAVNIVVKKRLLALVLCILLLVPMNGCSGEALRDGIRDILRPSEKAADPTVYLEEFRTKDRYERLSPDLQSCYGSLYTALCKQFSKDTTVRIALDDAETESEYPGLSAVLPVRLFSSAEVKTVFEALLHDNPQFFYLSYNYGLEGKQRDGVTYFDRIKLIYHMDLPTRTAAKKELDTTVDAIFAAIPETQDAFTRELYLHDALAGRCTYDATAAKEDYAYAPLAYSAYGALADGHAVCSGYAFAMLLLLQKAGFDATVVNGNVRETGESHLWNLVTVDGERYYLDATWDDNNDELRHNYFNITTAQLEQTHSVFAEEAAYLEPCTATAANYFVRTGAYIDSYHRQDIAAAIAAAVKDGKSVIELSFAADKYNSALLFLKNSTLTCQMVDAILAPDGLALWDYALEVRMKEHLLALLKK